MPCRGVYIYGLYFLMRIYSSIHNNGILLCYTCELQDFSIPLPSAGLQLYTLQRPYPQNTTKWIYYLCLKYIPSLLLYTSLKDTEMHSFFQAKSMSTNFSISSSSFTHNPTRQQSDHFSLLKLSCISPYLFILRAITLGPSFIFPGLFL